MGTIYYSDNARPDNYMARRRRVTRLDRFLAMFRSPPTQADTPLPELFGEPVDTTVQLAVA